MTAKLQLNPLRRVLFLLTFFNIYAVTFNFSRSKIPLQVHRTLITMSQYFGFELLFNSVKSELNEKHELFVVVFHWFLIREGFLCLGVGTEVRIDLALVNHEGVTLIHF